MAQFGDAIQITRQEKPLDPLNTQTRQAIEELKARLSEENRRHQTDYPCEAPGRQPIHTVYGGAHLFKPDTAAVLGSLAVRTLQAYAPDSVSFARCVALPGAEDLPSDPETASELRRRLDDDPEKVRCEQPAAWLAHAVYARTVAKLEREPVEDYRIDFEDGYGNRPDAEEDAHAEQAAQAVARGMRTPLFPPLLGIRIKPFSEALRERSMRTLELFLTTLLTQTAGRLPDGFVVTLPKVGTAAQVSALAELLRIIETEHGLAANSLRIELMIETPESIVDSEGRFAIPTLLKAAPLRCRGLHFGAYDFTAACDITAQYQSLFHPAADFARHVMQVCTAGRGVELSDGATTILPIAPHKPGDTPLTERQKEENQLVVYRAMRLHFQDVQRSLKNGFYQGWDLHPAQLPTRYAAVYAFFLQGFDSASARLRNFIGKAAQATSVGDTFDDAATGQGLLNYFLRAWNCGSITEEEVLSTGLTVEELRRRSFLKILENRRGQ